ncbi:hypothetical protein LCGC14_1164170 [marine sediment metagenome]|uniref:Uncharacterized protein n=1 Tax=marine sediment metagenome TaxID=412755 RepID=A0A0F9LWT4_9ZZZZ
MDEMHTPTGDLVRAYLLCTDDPNVMRITLRRFPRRGTPFKDFEIDLTLNQAHDFGLEILNAAVFEAEVTVSQPPTQ